MIYLQLRGDMTWQEARPLHVGDVAYILPRDASVTELPFLLSTMDPVTDFTIPGEYCVTALDVITQIRAVKPELEFQLLGTSQMWVSVSAPPKSPQTKWLRQAIVFILLLLGSAMGIVFFHADVDMHAAQDEIMRIVANRESFAPLELALPYAIGMFIGVGGFFLIGGKSKSPLAIKLCAYRQQAKEQQRNDGD